jgi:hypothetical protein
MIISDQDSSESGKDIVCLYWAFQPSGDDVFQVMGWITSVSPSRKEAENPKDRRIVKRIDLFNFMVVIMLKSN